jgi:hypothetical protein
MKNKINPHTEYYIVIILAVAVYILMGWILGLIFLA